MQQKYRVSEEAYIDYLEYRLRQKGKQALSLVCLFACTVVQFGLCLYLCLSGAIPAAQRGILLGLSLAICAMQVFRRCTVGYRAKTLYKRLTATGKLSPAYHGEHTLRIEDGVLTDSFGSESLCFPLTSFTRTAEYKRAFLLLFDGEAKLILPLDTFTSSQRSELMQALAESDVPKRAPDVFHGETTADSPIPKEAEYLLHLRYTKPDCCLDQVRAYRLKYLTARFWKGAMLIKAALTAALVVWVVMDYSLLHLGIAAALALVLNLSHLINFSPALRRTVERDAKLLIPFVEEGGADLYITASELVYANGDNSLVVPIAQICDMIKTKTRLMLYTLSNAAVVVPVEAAKDEEEWNAVYARLRVRVKNYKELSFLR